MNWLEGVSLFVGGVFLANSFPHFVSGVLGRSFPTPFAKPPFRGPSSPTVNVLWGLFNLAVSYLLLVSAGNFALGCRSRVGIAAAGFALAALGIARASSKTSRE